MWTTDTYWFDFSIVSLIYAIGNMLFGHFEEHTPKWRRVLKYLFTIIIVITITHYFGRIWSYGLLAALALFVIYVHGIALPKKGINGWTGEPKEKYYEFRGWDKSKLYRESKKE